MGLGEKHWEMWGNWSIELLMRMFGSKLQRIIATFQGSVAALADVRCD